VNPDDLCPDAVVAMVQAAEFRRRDNPPGWQRRDRVTGVWTAGGVRPS
jgi:hypothetical protein